jgi:hypothetical protein
MAKHLPNQHVERPGSLVNVTVMWLLAPTLWSCTVTDDARAGMTPEKETGVGVGPGGVAVGHGVGVGLGVGVDVAVTVPAGVGVAAGGHDGGGEPPPTMMDPC